MELLLAVLWLGVCLVVAALVLSGRLTRRGGEPSAEVLAQLQRLQAELAQVGRGQESLREGQQRLREASLQELAEATQGIRGELGLAQRALAEVKAIEQGRARQLEQAADSLRRLEAVVAGSSSRGAAGENILGRAFSQLPADLIEVNVAFGNKVVEYALHLPGGARVPIDSKWPRSADLEALDQETDPRRRRHHVDQIVRDIRGRIREVAKYLDPDRTPGLALLAVPDAVYFAAPEAHGEGHRLGVLVVPYSLALPFVLALYRLALRFGAGGEEPLAARLRGLDELLHRIDDEAEGRLSRGLVLAGNARDAIRGHLSEARRVADRALHAAERSEARENEPPATAIDGSRSGDIT